MVSAKMYELGTKKSTIRTIDMQFRCLFNLPN